MATKPINDKNTLNELFLSALKGTTQAPGISTKTANSTAATASPLLTPSISPLTPSKTMSPVPTKASPVVSNKPIFTAPQESKVPQGQAPAQQTPSSIPSQWMKPDGGIYTPEEVAANIASKMTSTKGTGDIGNISRGEFGGAQKTAEQLQAEAVNINNTRNDIAVGEKDPYKIASESGIAYTPAELAAIEKSYAGIYDPALTSAKAKLDAKVKSDEEEKEFNNSLKKLAVTHDYDLDKMAKDNEYKMIIEKLKINADLAKASLKADGSSGKISPYSDERSVRTVQSVDELLKKAKDSPGIFGRTAAMPIPDFLRSDEYRDFSSELNTLKSAIAFNELTAMREASKTGGALGNVSNIELALLESALGALSMSQSPDNFTKQLKKVKESINRWRTAQGASEIPGSTSSESSGNIITAPDGTLIEFID